MPSRKRSRSGTALVRSSGRSAGGSRASFNKRVSKRRYKVTRGGISARYTFSRWLVSQKAANITVTGGTYTTSTSVLSCGASVSEIDVGQQFTLDSLPNVAEFNNLFDQYRIKKIEITLKLINVPENSGGPLTNNANYGNFYPTIWWVNDKDDAAPYTLAQIKEVQGVKHRVLFPNRELKMSVTPTMLTQMYRTAVTTGYSPKRASYCDIAQMDTAHYANKFVVDLEGFNTAILPANLLPQIKVNYRMMFECKGVR